MLVTPAWCRMMARYAAWQNEGQRAAVASLPEAEATRDRGAAFGSILGTLNHLLWADQVWLVRLRGGVPALGGIPGSVTLTPSAAAWAAERGRVDGDLLAWAEGLAEADLARDLTWTPASGGPPRTRPLGPVVTHLFNHGTHHRGQVHALLTAAGARPPPTDLIALPGLEDLA